MSSGERFAVSINEIRQSFVFGDLFSGTYTKSVTMSDGTVRQITLRPMMRGGHLVVELTDGDHVSYMGPNGTTTHGTLMITLSQADGSNADPGVGMDVEKVAAERTFYAFSPAGLWHEVTLTVLAPSPRPGGGWRAPVRLKGLDDRVHDIAGMDSWQALSLATRFASVRLGHYVEAGWTLSWDRGGASISPEDF